MEKYDMLTNKHVIGLYQVPLPNIEHQAKWPIVDHLLEPKTLL